MIEIKNLKVTASFEMSQEDLKVITERIIKLADEEDYPTLAIYPDKLEFKALERSKILILDMSYSAGNFIKSTIKESKFVRLNYQVLQKVLNIKGDIIEVAILEHDNKYTSFLEIKIKKVYGPLDEEETIESTNLIPVGLLDYDPSFSFGEKFFKNKKTTIFEVDADEIRRLINEEIGEVQEIEIYSNMKKREIELSLKTTRLRKTLTLTDPVVVVKEINEIKSAYPLFYVDKVLSLFNYNQVILTFAEDQPLMISDKESHRDNVPRIKTNIFLAPRVEIDLKTNQSLS